MGKLGRDVRWFLHPLPQPPTFPTTYREEVLVGKLASETSPPPIQMSGSWGSWPRRRPLVMPPSTAVRWHAAPRLPGLVAAGVRVLGGHRRCRTAHCAHACDGSPVSAIRAPRAEPRALASMRRCQQVLRRVPLHHLRTAARPSRDFRCESRELEPPWSDSAPHPPPHVDS